MVFQQKHFSWKMFSRKMNFYIAFFVVWYKINNFSSKKKISIEVLSGEKY